MEYFEIKNKDVYLCFGSGEKYLWQYGGSLCNQGQIENPNFLGTSKSKIFNSNWWYGLSHFDNFVIPNFNWKINFESESFDEILSKGLKRVEKSKKKITFEELFKEVIMEANTLNKNFTDFQLNQENLTDRNEAYVPVSFSYLNERKNGILIWNNCD